MIREGASNFDILEANQLFLGGFSIPPYVGTIYCVDGNAGNDGYDGKSWGSAFKTLAVAMAASQADIAASSKGWASRNIIFYKADVTKDDDGENLVLLAQKTDVIGIGSTDWRAKPQLLGNHVIPATAETHGCRFFNMSFVGPAAGGDLWKLTDQHGVEFIDCNFRGDSTAAATGALTAIACVDLKVHRCKFLGAYSDAVIEIGAGQADGLVITESQIYGANNGIEISGDSTFAAGKYGLIKENLIHTTGICISDSESKSYIINNRLITAAAEGTAMAGAIVCNIKLAQDNRITTSDKDNVIYPANGAIAS